MRISPDDIDSSLPKQVASTGLFTLPICIKSFAILKSIKPIFTKIKKIYDKLNVGSYHIFTFETLESKYPDLITPDSPTQRVGESPLEGFTTVGHKIPMLSLANSYTYDELQDFDERIKKNVGDVEYIVEPKIDGTGVAGSGSARARARCLPRSRGPRARLPRRRAADCRT